MSRNITIWSVLALTAAVAGTALTLAAGRLWLARWVASGQKFPIAQRGTVYIPPEGIDSLVYYESDHSVEEGFMRLYVRDAYDQRYSPARPADDNQFEIAGRQGRAMFELDLEEAGEYTFRCDNANYASDDEIPATDRVVFLKTPNTRSEVLSVRRMILAIGGSVTVLLTVLFYVLHAWTLSRRD